MVYPTRRSVLGSLAASAVAATLLGCAASKKSVGGARRPNIIFILADDLGYGDLGCYGQERIQTPNLDRMAAEGTRFTQAYAASTVCAPSRCGLMTGMHMGHAYIRGNARDPLRPEDVTVAEVLKSAGYATGLCGKWGLGEEGSIGTPNKKGFDYFYGYLNQRHAHNSWPTFLVRNESRVKLKNVVPDADAEGAGTATEKVEFSGHLIQAEGLKFIERNKDKPFFLYLAHTMPHANNEAKTIDVPNLGIYKDKDWPEAQKLHAANITLLDQYVGEVLRKLAELGLDDNTLVLFSSDNGPHKEGGNDPKWARSSGPLRGIKRDLYEGGIRVPTIARWPGHVPAGRTSDQIWAFWDFLPTAAELAGTSSPPCDGISMLPAILGQPQSRQHEYLYWEFHEGGFKQAVRMGQWKAVRLGTKQPVELYDISRDIGEQNNVAAQHPDVVARVEQILASARTDSKLWPIREPARKTA